MILLLNLVLKLGSCFKRIVILNGLEWGFCEMKGGKLLQIWEKLNFMFRDGNKMFSLKSLNYQPPLYITFPAYLSFERTFYRVGGRTIFEFFRTKIFFRIASSDHTHNNILHKMQTYIFTALNNPPKIFKRKGKRRHTICLVFF